MKLIGLVFLLFLAHEIAGAAFPPYINLGLFQPRHDKKEKEKPKPKEKGKKHKELDLPDHIELDHGYITSFGPMVKISIPQPFFGYNGGGYYGWR